MGSEFGYGLGNGYAIGYGWVGIRNKLMVMRYRILG